MEHQTKDIGEAACLISAGCFLRDILWKDQVAYFLFNDPTSCQVIAQEYYFGSFQVNARQYFDNIRMLKRRLFNKIR